MKLKAGQIDAFIRAPDPAVRAVLLFGPDQGLARERADSLCRQVAEDANDPFRVSMLSLADLKDGPQSLLDEAAALSLTGGRRVVRVQGVSDRQAGPFEAFFADPLGEALIIVEAGDLGARSRLRRAFEGAPIGAALPCYRDEGKDLQAVVRSILAQARLEIDGEAMVFLVESLGGDRQQTRGEIDKLVTYMGSDRRAVTLGDVVACVGDGGTMSLEDVAFAAAAGDQPALDRALARALADGISPIAVLRALARHLTRLHLAAGLMDGGMADSQVAGAMRPPVFYKRRDAFRAQARRWMRPRLGDAIAHLIESEIACKTTGMPAEALCGRALMRVAWMARAGAARR